MHTGMIVLLSTVYHFSLLLFILLHFSKTLWVCWCIKNQFTKVFLVGKKKPRCHSCQRWFTTFMQRRNEGKKIFLCFIDAFYTRFSAFSEQFIALKSRKYAAQWELFDFSDIKTNWMKNTTLFYEFIFLFFGFNLRYELMERIFRLHNAEFVGHAASFPWSQLLPDCHLGCYTLR